MKQEMKEKVKIENLNISNDEDMVNIDESIVNLFDQNYTEQNEEL